jgi:HD-GYP domain-containing protein (c-di-GMP phosphodiesterase class II)
MQSISTSSSESALERIRLALRKIDALGLPSSVRPRVETALVRQVAKIMDQAMPWQQGHGRRTAALAQAIGTVAGLCQETLHHLTLAALVHDIGLLALPNGPASPTGYLDAGSYAALQCHPRLGAQWLESFPFLRHASVIIAHHHERWDGSGYPYGIRGRFIPLEARVLAIADAFDAIQVPGVTEQATRDRTAYRILTAAAGTQFDPRLVELCGHCLQQPNLICSFN